METQDKEVKTQQQIAQEYAQMRTMTLEHCKVEIDAVLKRHGCSLIAVPEFTPDGRVMSRVQIVFSDGR